MAASAAALAFASAVAAVAAVGCGSWIRTGPLRRGHARAPDMRRRAGEGVRASSPTTWLAAASGVAAAIAAVLATGRPVPLRVAVLAAGAAIGWSGIRSRVTGLDVRLDALIVRRALRPPVVLPWDRIRSIRPPASPIGGWRLGTAGASIVLMPSDVRGNEDVLALAVRRAGLRFDGRAWSRPLATIR